MSFVEEVVIVVVGEELEVVGVAVDAEVVGEGTEVVFLEENGWCGCGENGCWWSGCGKVGCGRGGGLLRTECTESAAVGEPSGTVEGSGREEMGRWCSPLRKVV